MDILPLSKWQNIFMFHIFFYLAFIYLCMCLCSSMRFYPMYKFVSSSSQSKYRTIHHHKTMPSRHHFLFAPSPSPSLPFCPLGTSNFIFSSVIFLYWECHINGIIQHVNFPPLIIILLRSTQVVTGINSFILLSSIPLHGCVRLCSTFQALKDRPVVSSIMQLQTECLWTFVYRC